MEEILTLKIDVKNVEDIISKIVKINTNIKLSTFVYTTLASMNAINADEYNLKINDKSIITDKTQNIAKEKLLSEINLTDKDKIEIEYGKNSQFTFIVEVLKKENIKENINKYPKVIEEKGYGILEDVMDTNGLEKIIKEQKEEYNKYGYTLGYKYYKDNIKQNELETYVYNAPLYTLFEEKYNVFKNILSFVELKYLNKMEEENEQIKRKN